MPLTTTVEGLERYTVNLRYDRDFRSRTSESLARDIVVPTPTGAQIPLGQLAAHQGRGRARWASRARARCPTPGFMWTSSGMDVGTYVQMAMHAVNEAVASGAIKLPPRLQHFLERPVRIHAARQAAADDRRAADAAHHLAHHLPEHPLGHQDRHRHAGRAVLAGRRVLDALPAALQSERGRLGRASSRWPAWTPKPASSCCSTSTLPTTNGSSEGQMRNARRPARRHLSRRGQTRPPQSHDRLRHHRAASRRFSGATAPART